VSYTQFPAEPSITLDVKEDMSGGNQVIVHNVICSPHSEPPKLDWWLTKLGWSYAMHDPTTNEQLYTKQSEPAANYMYYRWYEAVAYESFKFMTLADGQNET